MTTAWFTSGTQPFDYSRFTPEAALRGAQAALGVTADGKYGPRTNAAFQSTLNALINNNAQAPEAATYRRALQETQGLRNGQALGSTAWAVLASIGLQQMDSARFNNISLAITGGAPSYAAGTTTTTPAPTPTRAPATSSTPATRTTSTPAQGSSAAEAFYKRNKTAIWVGGGVALAAIVGLVGYSMFSGEDEDEQPEPRREPPMPPNRQLPARAGEDEDRDEDRPRLEYRGPGKGIELASRMLGIRSDADAPSIRAAYAREAGKYPRSDDDSEMRRAQLKRARDFLLRQRGTA